MNNIADTSLRGYTLGPVSGTLG